jgi:hypothetical protein
VLVVGNVQRWQSGRHPPVTETSQRRIRGTEVPEKLRELCGRLETERAAQPVAVESVVAHRLEFVAFAEVRLHQDPVRALSQRIPAERREGGVHRLSEPALRREPLHNRLQRMEPELVYSLPLEQHPIVVPVREKLSFEEEAVAALGYRGMTEEVVGEIDLLADIDGDAGRQLHLLTGCLYEFGPTPTDSPQG